MGFTVYKVDTIDLTSNQGWIDANDLADLDPDSVADITAAGYTASAETLSGLVEAIQSHLAPRLIGRSAFDLSLIHI